MLALLAGVCTLVLSAAFVSAAVAGPRITFAHQLLQARAPDAQQGVFRRYKESVEHYQPQNHQRLD